MDPIVAERAAGLAGGPAAAPFRIVATPARAVFLSSTARDLAEYRAAAFGMLCGLDGYSCVRMEDFGARDDAAADFCRDRVRECQLVVFVIGHLHGSCPPGEQRSFTEIEYDTAVAEKLPRLVFVAPDDFPLPANLFESDAERARQRAFRERVGAERIRDEFASPADLATRLVKAIRNWEAQQARQAFSALRDLMDERPVRDAVVRYEADFQAVSRRIDTVADFKGLHDQLHGLQFRCFDVILQEARLFPEESALERLDDYLLGLSEIIHCLERIAAAGTVGAYDTSWIGSLQSAAEDLRVAVDTVDRARLDRAVWCLSRVLALQPPAINARLNQAVGDLPLAGLVGTLETLRARLAGLGLDAAKVHDFEEGVASLKQLDAQLHRLTSRHNRWQLVDQEVRRIDANLRRDLFELRMSWPTLVAMAESLLEETPALRQEAERLGEALAADDEAAARRLFRRYNRLVGTTFYRVDSDLKTLCDQLRRVGEPLTSVLAILP
jgi:hypothetical protein